jgi:hypothetical protein
MKKTAFFALFFILLVHKGYSQAGEGIYKFLSLPASSHIAALGGTNVSITEKNLSFVFQNPALLSLEMHNNLAVNFTSYISDIVFGSAAYSYKLNDKAYLSAGTLFVHYGKFSERDMYGEELGTFSAADLAFYITYGQILTDNWSFGTTLKPIISSYEQYNSFGLALDVGLSYNAKKQGISAGVVLKNIGRQLNGFYKTGSKQHIEDLPFEIQAGFSTKFEHAPFRISLTLHNLQRWDMGFENNIMKANADGVMEKVDNKLKFGDNLMRHAIFGIELVPSNLFYIAIGYNHQRNKELKAINHKSITNGFSAGVGLNLKKMSFGFSVAKYHAGNASFHFSFSTDLNSFNL